MKRNTFEVRYLFSKKHYDLQVTLNERLLKNKEIKT